MLTLDWICFSFVFPPFFIACSSKKKLILKKRTDPSVCGLNTTKMRMCVHIHTPTKQSNQPTCFWSTHQCDDLCVEQISPLLHSQWLLNYYVKKKKMQLQCRWHYQLNRLAQTATFACQSVISVNSTLLACTYIACSC